MDTAIAYVTIPDLAEQMDLSVTKVHQLIKDGQLVAVRPVEDGPRLIPAAFVQEGVVVKSLGAVIVLLRDARYRDEEIVAWLHRPDDSLPGSPIEALRENRGTEVKRRAQVAGY